MKELAYLDGVFGPISEAKVSIEDRGFQFGDSLYEVIAVYNGQPFLLHEHIQRMRTGAGAISLAYDFDNNPLEPIIQEGITRSQINDAYVYIQITRGVAPRAHGIPQDLVPTVVMTFKPLPPVPADRRAQGLRMITLRDDRWANCYIKATTLLPNILAKSEATRRGYDDAVFVASDGSVRECTSANIYTVNDGSIVFPPRTHSVLHGITQGFLMLCAADAGIGIKEARIDVAALQTSDEVFMSNTMVEVLGVTCIDDKTIGQGKPGPVTKKLYEAFCSRARGVAVSEPSATTP